jgi:hypothetical protein
MLIVGSDPSLRQALEALARDARLVFFTGLPGTGKSLLIHQLAHLAHARKRRVYLLQWDVARPLFEESRAGRPYPQAHGVTHGVIRIAVGRWARAAVSRWDHEHPRLDDVMIGETPFVGHRLIDLARRGADTAETVLSAPTTRFVIPVPSAAVRAHVEAERARRAETPLHAREREDAPPEVLRDLWRQLATIAGVTTPNPPYDPDTYRRMYERLLVHRHAQVLPIETRLPTEAFSAYDFRVPATDVIPSEAEAAHFIAEVEARYPDPGAVDREIADWHRV